MFGLVIFWSILKLELKSNHISLSKMITMPVI